MLLHHFTDFDIDSCSEHTEIIREHYTFLVKHLDLIISGLIYELYKDNVIEDEEKDELQSIDVSASRNERLLSILWRKPSECFEKFLLALNKYGQNFIAETIKKGISA